MKEDSDTAMPSWEQSEDVIQMANGALTSKWKVNQFHSLLIQVQKSLYPWDCLQKNESLHLQLSKKHILKTTGCFTASLQTQAGMTTKQKVYVIKESISHYLADQWLTTYN